MKDHVLFKGRRIDNGEIVKGYLWRGADIVVIVPFNLGIDYNYGANVMTARAYQVDEESVEMSTTLDDKNCKTIYGGDTVKTKFFGKNNGNGVNFNDYDTFKVVFHDGQFFLENETRRFTLTAEVARKLEILEEQL